MGLHDEVQVKEYCTVCGMVTLGLSIGIVFVIIRESLGMKF